MKTKPCTLGPRHKWTWMKNVTQTTQSGRSFRMSARGLYKCKCGATKIGLTEADCHFGLFDEDLCDRASDVIKEAHENFRALMLKGDPVAHGRAQAARAATETVQATIIVEGETQEDLRSAIVQRVSHVGKPTHWAPDGLCALQPPKGRD